MGRRRVSSRLPPQDVMAVVIPEEEARVEPALDDSILRNSVIWTAVSDRLMDPQDLENFGNSCKFFRWILKPRRVEYLFPKVWKILVKKYEKEKDEAYGPVREGPEPVNHNERFKGTVQLRGVSRTWCKTLDEQYVRDSIYYLTPGDYYKWDPHEQSFYYDTLGKFGNFHEHDETRIQKFVTMFRNSHYEASNNSSFKNPFLGRLLRIHYMGEESHARNFWNSMTTCLTLFGKHVWFCELHSSVYQTPGTDHYTKTCDLLQLMPNTKMLTFSYACEDTDDETEEMNIEFNRQELEQRLQIEVVVRPMPHMPNLKCLEVGQLPGVIFNSLALSNPQIEVLHVSNTVKTSINHYDFSLLPGLTTFSLAISHKSDLRILKEVKWPGLKKLNLDFLLCDDGLVSWTTAFPIIEKKWAATLTDFRLELPGSDDPCQEFNTMIECSMFRLQLPNIERLKFTMGHFATLDFILPMAKSLQELDITVKCNVARARRSKQAARIIANRQVIQFIGYFHKMLQSNIWEMFPKLQVLHLNEVYHKGEKKIENEWTLQREDWKRLMRKRARGKKRRQSGSYK